MIIILAIMALLIKIIWEQYYKSVLYPKRKIICDKRKKELGLDDGYNKIQ